MNQESLWKGFKLDDHGVQVNLLRMEKPPHIMSRAIGGKGYSVNQPNMHN